MNEIPNEIIQAFQTNPHPKVKFIWQKSDAVTTETLFKTADNQICFFKKGSRKKGFRLNSELTYLKQIILIQQKQKNYKEEWEKSLKKARERLNASGLWQNVKQNIDTALSIGFDKIQEAYAIQNDYGKDDRTERIKAIDERLIYKDQDGKEHIETEILWHLSSILKIKKMNFGITNRYDLENIKTAMENKKDFTTHAKANYDITFEYKADNNRAWYSEEYKGCGNGHYYLALDNTHAVFWEDD